MGEDKKKLSYEDMEVLLKQLTEQNNILMNQGNQMNMITFFKRLDYLFKIVEFSDKFPKEIMKKVVEEIDELLLENTEDNK